MPPKAKSSRGRPRPASKTPLLQEPSAFDHVYRIVRAIPYGKVMTYGQISGLMGRALSPLAVGWALHKCADDVPWHRVVNASGGCSTNRLGDMPVGLQQSLLEREGIAFSSNNTLDLSHCQWNAGAIAGAFVQQKELS